MNPTVRPTVAQPLSPHLQIYRWTWTMAMSVFHRITGTALYGGTFLVVVWLVALASGPRAYDTVAWFFGSLIGRAILFAYTWVLMHHMLGGIRHFIWDTGYGFDRDRRLGLARATLIGSITLTVVIWAIALLVRWRGSPMSQVDNRQNTALSMRTPRARVKGLGASGHGAGHFWLQRLTGASNALLMLAFVVIIALMAGRTYPQAVALVSHPLVSIILILAVVSVTIHMRLGMQTVIEDYVHSHGLKFAALIANTFYAVAVAAACLYAIIRVSLGGLA